MNGVCGSIVHSCGFGLKQVLYVFVEISFDTSHLVECIQRNFDSAKRIALMGTIQVRTAWTLRAVF
jgi:diphthamide biosynthesis enzyme Dph1/Dph2-like protein